MLNDRSRQSICVEVARLLQEERLRQALSMTAVAEKAGLSQQMVSYVERGMRTPTLDTLLRLSGVLQLPLWVVIKQAVDNLALHDLKTGARSGRKPS